MQQTTKFTSYDLSCLPVQWPCAQRHWWSLSQWRLQPIISLSVSMAVLDCWKHN